MQTQLQREQAYDRYLDIADMPEWSDSDINEAIENLEYEVMTGLCDWDDDGLYRVDFAIEVERILMHEDKDEQLALIKDARAKRVHDWAVSVVKHEPNWYCKEFCE